MKLYFRTFWALCLMLLGLIFTACHRENEISISYDINGGIGVTPRNMIVAEGGIIKLPLDTAFSYEKHIFSGWNTDKLGIGKSYDAGSRVSFNEDIVLYAGWDNIATCSGCNTVVDIQGNVYNTIQIGNQCWMRENLKVTKYDTQSERPNVSLDNSLSWSVGINEPYYTYCGDYSSPNQNKFGLLYNWPAAVGLEDGDSQTGDFADERQGICPNGWHIPTKNEWNELADFLGGDAIAGLRMKLVIDWSCADEIIGTNNSGFSALPAGFSLDDSYCFGDEASFWTASSSSRNDAYARNLRCRSFSEIVDSKYYNGFSIRCIKD